MLVFWKGRHTCLINHVQYSAIRKDEVVPIELITSLESSFRLSEPLRRLINFHLLNLIIK